MDRDPAIVVEPTPISLYPTVLALLHLDESQVHMLLTSAAEGRLSMEGLFHARRDQDYVGAAWGQIVPGRTAFTWPPRLQPGVDSSVSAGLLQAVDQYLLGAGITLSQAVLPDAVCADAQRLLAAGYSHFADLDYVACPRSRFPSSPPPSSLDFFILHPKQNARFASIIESTYHNTLDCDNLDQIRTTADTITGYQMTGQHRPEWWLIAQHQGADVGCLIMADHEADDQCEVVYMGIVPEARGRGFGRQLVEHALWLAACQDRQRLVLAVDRRNWPARNIYTASGFQAWATRSILLKQFVT
jgi:ribosomal protein S18 acetylase RimI-like enzyme